MPEPSDRPLVSAFWIWIALTVILVSAGPLLRHHRASHQDAALLDVSPARR